MKKATWGGVMDKGAICYLSRVSNEQQKDIGNLWCVIIERMVSFLLSNKIPPRRACAIGTASGGSGWRRWTCSISWYLYFFFLIFYCIEI